MLRMEDDREELRQYMRNAIIVYFLLSTALWSAGQFYAGVVVHQEVVDLPETSTVSSGCSAANPLQAPPKAEDAVCELENPENREIRVKYSRNARLY